MSWHQHVLCHLNCLFSRSTIMKYFGLGGLNSRNLLSHHSGGQKSGIKMLTSFVSSDGRDRECAPSLPPSFWWFAGNTWHSLACVNITLISCIYHHMVFACVCVSKCPLFVKSTSSFGVRGPSYYIINPS